MPRDTTVTPHLPVADLTVRYRHATDLVERSHWQIVWLVAQGQRVPTVAAVVGNSANWGRPLIRPYNADGALGLVDRRSTNPGAKPLVTPTSARANAE